MKKFACSVAVAVLLFLVTSGPAFALYIDFTDSAFTPTSGTAVHQVTDPISITIQALGANGTSPKLTWYNDDGYGIHGGGGYEVDEIETPESMSISFSQETFVKYISLTDLFYETRMWGPYEEIGWYNFSGDFTNPGSYTEFNQTNHGILPSPISNGEFTLHINDYVSTIWFSAPGKTIFGQDHEFSVAGMEVAPVPEPATMILLGTGLIGLAGISRKRKMGRNKKR